MATFSEDGAIEDIVRDAYCEGLRDAAEARLRLWLARRIREARRWLRHAKREGSLTSFTSGYAQGEIGALVKLGRTPHARKPQLKDGAWLDALIRRNYEPIKDEAAIKECAGAQMFRDQWWMPIWGCDTLENLIDDLEGKSI